MNYIDALLQRIPIVLLVLNTTIFFSFFPPEDDLGASIGNLLLGYEDCLADEIYKDMISYL